MVEFIKHPSILRREKSSLLIVDVQERLYKVMRKYNELLDNLLKLTKGAKLLELPIFYTEQYPQGLGETVNILKQELLDNSIQKLSFSCQGAGNLFRQLKETDVEQVIVCGIEAHVCVQQTVLDLLANEFQVYLPINAISSRKKIDYKTAIRRMESHGAEITSVESLLFELLQTCDVPEFKAVSSLIK